MADNKIKNDKSIKRKPKEPTPFERAFSSAFKRAANGSRWTEDRQPRDTPHLDSDLPQIENRPT